ncbi:MAG: PD-(D/E)XK nuclease family protein [Clostridia bacterium]
MSAHVRIITARPHRLFQPIVNELGQHLQREEPSILLVPEQFTLQAERELLARLKLQGFFTLNVLSPSRLYERVLSSAGHDERQPLSDAGRRMAVSQALERLENKLPYYGSIAHRRGFVEKLAALITDLKSGGMTPEALEAYAATLPSGLTHEKFADLSRIFAQYRAVLRDRFSDSEDLSDYVAKRLPLSDSLSGQHLVVYGFDTLPDTMMRFLCACAPLCESLTVALICDFSMAEDSELFLPIRQGIKRFTAMLANAGIQTKLTPLPPEPLPHAPAIAYLDSALFALHASKYPEPQQSIFLFSALSPFEEATLMSRQALRLLENGVDLERIAVLYPDQNGYDFAVSAALRDSGIPFYTDQKLPATSHGLVRFLLCALRAMADGYRNADLLGMLKSGYAPLCFEEGCELENYAYSYGISKSRWLKPFTKGEAALCERMEALRKKLMEPLLHTRAALVAAKDTVASMTAAFGLLTECNAYEVLKREEQQLTEHGLLIRANQNSQIWSSILTLFDQMVHLSDGARIPLKHIASRLECGFSAIALASLPPASGMLHAGTLGHLLTEGADAVFLLGLNDSILSRATESLLTPEERAQAQESTGNYLGLTDESRALFAKLDLKRAMTLPTKWLYLSYAKTAPDGTALRPASLLASLQTRMFTSIAQSPIPQGDLPFAAPQALAELSLLLRAHMSGELPEGLSPQRQAILKALLESPDTAPSAMRLLRALHFDGSSQQLDPAQARALFGDESLSVSRLEQFAGCPFKHFINYGLRPHVLREWKVDPIETGNFYHASLDRFAKLAKANAAYPNIPEEAVEHMAEEAIAPLLEELLGGPMGDGERSRARFEQARAAIRRAAVTITRQLSAGSFTLYQTEASFGYEGGLPPIVLSLADGREVMLRGRIDRIDRYDAPNAVYLRVIDYKSAQQSLDAARTWWGLQLQLLLYLDVCTSAIPNGKPAGAFYFYVADPLVESDTDLAPIVEAKLRDVFQLRGITLTDVEILNAMDAGDVPCVLPSVYLKSGELRKTAKALNMPQMLALLEHARQVAAQLASELFSGTNAITPTLDAGRSSCDYCDFKPICRFDTEAPETIFRELPEMSMDELRLSLTKGDADDA